MSAMFLIENLVDESSISSADTRSTSSVENIKNDLRAVYWEASYGTGSKVIDITLPSGAEYDTIAMIDHNLGPASLTGFDIDAYDTGFGVGTPDNVELKGFHTGPEIGAEIYRYPPVGYPLTNVMNFANPVWVHRYSTTKTARYIRITMTGGTVVPYKQLGRVFIGKRWEPSETIDAKPSVTFVENSRFTKTAYGVPMGQELVASKVVNFNMTMLPKSERRDLMRRLYARGLHRPIVAQLRSDRGEDDMHLAMYGQVEYRMKLFTTDADDGGLFVMREWI